MRKVSIVIPTCNEKENIEPLIREIDDALRDIDHEVIFVDDSTDDTTRIIDKIARQKAHVKYIHRKGKKGLASAVVLGFQMAKGEYLACMDGDLQHPPKILLPMYAAMEAGADLCLPSRFIKGGRDGGLNPCRKLISVTAGMIGKLLVKALRPVSDPTGGLFMARRSVVESANLKPVGWKILAEILATARYARIIEIPYAFAGRNAGSSKMSSKAALQYLQQCLSLRKRSRNNQKVIIKRWSYEKTLKIMRKGALSH
ncbi:MAG: polyprenol monophosphomannose synthase [Lachnospiraceae bacterium]|nr:polyprenol monophosphomannose synthase [Lachnospiraceae bacterium]